MAGYNPLDILSPLNLPGFSDAALILDARDLTTGILLGPITALELAPAASVPEPGAWALAALALAGLAGRRRQRTRGARSSALLLLAAGVHDDRPVR